MSTVVLALNVPNAGAESSETENEPNAGPVGPKM